MYLAVDIGGTKTLVATFENKGKITHKTQFPTAKNYSQFLADLKLNLEKLETKEFSRAVVAVPGKLDRPNGLAVGFGNLQWDRVPIQNDVKTIVNCPTAIENDAKLAGLSEALLIKDDFKRVLYVTIGTGIGTALIVNGVIDLGMTDSEGGQMWIEHQGKRIQWEDLASGKAIVKRFGKRASEIHDDKTWRIIANNIAVGLIDLIVVIQPEVVVLGGGVATNYSDFSSLLKQALKKYQTRLTPIPPLRQAQRPAEAVIYGCYEFAKSHAKST